MPTIFTALRAKHQPVIAKPQQVLPASTTAPPAGKRFLEFERELGIRAQPRPTRHRHRRPTRKVAVIGAGLAGLCCAYEMQGLGYDVTVYEARERVGGRVESIRNFVRGKVAEGGGELIGSNHPLWNSYARHFRLRFTDVKEYKNSPFRFGGKTLSFEDTQALANEMTKQLRLLSDLAETIVDPFEPWTNRNATRLDHLVLTDWLAKTKCSKRCKEALSAMLAADNGIPADQQSLLGVLAMVKGGGLDRYWRDTELYRCKGGNQQLASNFENRLNRHRRAVWRNCPVTHIRRAGKGVLLETTGGVSIGTFDDVVLAVPPSVWYRIRISDFPELALKLSTPPALGRNVKCLMKLRSRFWEAYASSPTLSEDGPVDLTWETTEQDRAGQFIMVAFSGSADADWCASWRSDSRKKNYVKALHDPYPGIDKQLAGVKFMDWPRCDWTAGAYYFPRRGEVTEWGPFWKSGYEDWFHFAGEHTCFAFVGYMEGALNSGYRLARRLATRDKILLA